MFLGGVGVQGGAWRTERKGSALIGDLIDLKGGRRGGDGRVKCMKGEAGGGGRENTLRSHASHLCRLSERGGSGA